MDEQVIETDDRALLWTATSGGGHPLVLCHGGPGDWDRLGPVATMVDDLVTVHRWDQRGAGRSSPRGPYTVARFVEDIEVLRRHFGQERWVVGGHSWGATLALLYAFAHPSRVSGLLYISGTGLGWERWRGSYHEERRRRMSPDGADRYDALKGRNRSRDEERETQLLALATDFADRERGAALAAESFDDRFVPNYDCNRALNDEMGTSVEAQLARSCRALTMPALIVHGEGDPRPAACVESLAAALPDARLRILGGVGHLPWAERPELLQAELRAFLRGVFAGLASSAG